MNTFATVGTGGVSGWVENLGFDGRGGMWASELLLGKLVRYGSNGVPGASLALASPGASGLEPDGRMFALFGDSSLPGAPPAGVVTFRPTAVMPKATPFVSGFSMANGGALDSHGNLYVSNTLKPGILKFSPRGVLDTAFEKATQISSADGVAISGTTLYVTQLASPGAAIVQVPLAHPSAQRVLASLSPAAGPDDLAVGPDGALYVAMASGQLVRVDRHTGAACVVVKTGGPATSVRFPIHFAPYSARAGDAFVSSELGTILRVHMTGLKPLPTISVTVTPSRVPRWKWRTLAVSASADPAACAQGANVRVGGYATRTNRRGNATLRVRFATAGRRMLTVHKRGCPTATGTLTVVT